MTSDRDFETNGTSSTLTTAAAENSSGLSVYRYLAVTAAVGIEIALGFLFHMGPNAYLVIGIPITVLFQIFVARRPLRELWLLGGQTIKWDSVTVLLLALFLIGPVQTIVSAFKAGNWTVTVYGFATIIGAAGAAIAFRALGKSNLRELGVILLLIISVGLFRLLTDLGVKAQGAGGPEIASRVWTAIQSLLFYIPASFVVEEVFFRGALDSHLHRHERGKGWLSAAYVSILWGLWHTPIVNPLTLRLFFEIVAAQLVTGLILSWIWRRTGNLAMNGTFHAVLDAIRNALAF